MKAIGLTEFGGPEVLHVVEVPEPEPGLGEVRIRVHTAGVNPADITFRSGGCTTQLATGTPPYIPGIDACGTVDALGTGLDGRLAIGDRVVAVVIPTGPYGGAYAEWIVADARSVVHAPAGVGDAEAATLLLNALTAQLALDALELEQGRPVAITGGTGAVGGYAIQIAALRGLTTITDAASGDESLLRHLGADYVVARGATMTDRIRGTVPGGVPGLVDGADLRDAVLPAVADHGTIASLKGWSGPAERGIRVAAVSSLDAFTDTGLLSTLVSLATAHRLTLRVADVLPAARAGEAHRRLAAGRVQGRLVLDFLLGPLS
ncbi:NADP-dependent oxidoreductase [Streptomyces sp. NBC_01384]|uniref:NADP-dependent oxidoreductase n=1 Tax=Streptomyces sp. NBC_01384 TaxID=2903847 RepID=UPI0032448F3A